MHTPLIHFHGFKFRGDARIEDALPHVLRDTGPIVKKKQRPNAVLFSCGEKNAARARVASVAQHFDNDVLDMLDVVLCLATLRF